MKSLYFYPKNWQEIKRKIMIRDKHRCIICHSERNLECDHLGRHVKHPSLEKLMILCHCCHKVKTRSLTHKASFKLFNEMRLRVGGFKDMNISSERIEILRKELLKIVKDQQKQMLKIDGFIKEKQL